MSRGVTLIAIGGHGYLKWAINMAHSIKFHSPDVAIQLITSDVLARDAQGRKDCFDIITEVSNDKFTDTQGRLFPAKLKTKLYSYLYFDETIYLDVDGCVLKDITPLFEQKADLVTDVQGVYDLSQGEGFDSLKWAKPAQIWFHFGLMPKDKLPAINSSFLFIRKSKQNEQLFELAHELLMTNEMPYSMHWHIWGHHRSTKVSQPDELYMNVAMAMLGIIPAHQVAIYFRLVTDRGQGLSEGEVRRLHYGIGLFGQLESNHRSCREVYDNNMRNVYREHVKAPFYLDAETLSPHKFAVI